VSVQARVRSILKGTEFLQADVDTLANDADLYAAGLNSHATVNLMLSLEEAFDVELPDRLLRRRTFASISSREAERALFMAPVNPRAATTDRPLSRKSPARSKVEEFSCR